MLYLALGTIVLSTFAILALCLGDPKRRRASGSGQGSMAARQRWLLVAITCIPGLACAILGDAAAFLMWLGGCALIGWSLALIFRPRVADD